MLKPIYAILFALIFLMLRIQTTGADESMPKDSPLPTVRETTLAALPDGYQIIPESIKISPDWRKVAFAAYSDHTHNIVQTNNQTSPVYYALRPNMPIWSPDNQKYAYIAYKNKTEAVVIVNGKDIGNFENADNFIFDPSGTQFAFRAQKNNRQFTVVDGNPGTPYDGILVKDNFAFSPDGKRFIYVAVKNKACVAVAGGREEPLEFNFITDVKFSPDSANYAYKARAEKKAMKEKWRVVKNGAPEPIYDKIFDIIFSYDSKHMAYAAIKDRQMVMVFDGKEIAEGNMVGFPLFSWDSKRFAYGMAQKNDWFIVLDNEKSTSFDQVYKFQFSLDSKRYSYIAKDGDNWLCSVDGEKGPKFETAIDIFRFSPDSTRFAYAGVNPERSLMITESGPSKEAFTSLGEPYFSLDSRHLVYRAFRVKEQKWTTVLDGKEFGKKYYGIGQYLFSPDSKHLAFPATMSADQSLMVVDGVEECADQKFKILGDPTFSPDGNYIIYHARAGEEKWHLIINGRVLPETYGGFYKGTSIVFDSPTSFHTLGFKPGGKEFVMIDVEIPDNFPKLQSGLK